MTEPLSDVMKRWQDNPQRYGYEGKREDAFRIADAACRLLPELVAACEAWEARLHTTFPPYKESESPSAKIAAALAHARELGATK